MSLATLFVTFPSAEDAERAAEAALAQRLAACVNILAPCRSRFRWRGRLEEAAEVPALFKTEARLLVRLAEAIRAVHPYETPAIIAWPAVFATAETGAWVAAETEAETAGDA